MTKTEQEQFLDRRIPFQFTLSPREKEAIASAAEKEHCSLANFIREAALTAAKRVR